MGIFNLTGQSETISREIFSDALALSTYTYHNLDNGLAQGYYQSGFQGKILKTLVNALIGSTQSQGVIPGIPWNPDSEAWALEKVNNAGWSVIKAEDLGYSGKVDKHGTYYGEKSGYTTAQAEILGKYDDSGQLIQLGIAFRGTSGPRENLIPDTLGDIINDIQTTFGPKGFSNTFATEAFGNLLKDVANFAMKNGLSGEDIVVSGHSLGGLAVNSMAFQSDSEWSGFYSSSNYIAFASPTQNEMGNKVLNVGFENDPVFRVLNGINFDSYSLIFHDNPHETTTDNIVNFNDYYASNLFNLTITSLFNLPSWISHMPFFYEDCANSILNSDFYSLTERDSTIIVSTLSDDTRESTWVQDLNRYALKHTGPTFIIGSDKDDLIKGGYGNDYLEGNKGNDTFRDEGGYNIIHGGEGYNTLDLQHALSKDEVAYDGSTLYLRNSSGDITIANDISTIRSKEKNFFFFNKEVDYTVTEQGLSSKNGNVKYANSVAGDAEDNTVTSASKGGWLFGLDGNDTLVGYDKNIFVGGEGDDILIAAGKKNTFIFNETFGNDTIYNFDVTDTLVFMGVKGTQSGNYQDFIHCYDNNVTLDFGENSVTLVGVNKSILDSGNFLFS